MFYQTRRTAPSGFPHGRGRPTLSSGSSARSVPQLDTTPVPQCHVEWHSGVEARTRHNSGATSGVDANQKAEWKQPTQDRSGSATGATGNRGQGGRARGTTEEECDGLDEGAQGHRAGQPESGVEAADTGSRIDSQTTRSRSITPRFHVTFIDGTTPRDCFFITLLKQSKLIRSLVMCRKRSRSSAFRHWS